MKHIVSFSGGKDSTAMLLRMLEENMQVDEIIYCDTYKEFPQMYKHIEKIKKYLFENYIPTSLVKEKIEEINKAYEDSKDENGESQYYYPDYTIRVLEGLLEKRE